MKYQVFDNGRPADSKGCGVQKARGWDNSIFDSLIAAQNYVNNWLGCFNGDNDIFLKVGEKHDYSGYGDIIEIREIS